MKYVALINVLLIFLSCSHESRAQGVMSLNPFLRNRIALMHKPDRPKPGNESLRLQMNNAVGGGFPKALQGTETDYLDLSKTNTCADTKRLQRKINGGIASTAQVYLIDTVIDYSAIVYYDIPSVPDTVRYRFFYNASGMITLSFMDTWQNGQWTNSSLDTCTYDANGNQLSDLNKQWQNDQWINNRLDSSTYDANGNRLTYLTGNWIEGQWTNYTLDIYTYDSKGNELTDMSEDWLNSQWQIDNIYRYTYDPRGDVLTEMYQSWQNGTWSTVWSETFTYDANGHKLTDLLEGELLDTFTYDTSGNELTDLDESWQNGQWVNNMVDSCTYDATGHQMTRSRWVWQNGQWSETYCVIHTYDASGHQLTYFVEYFQNGQWTNDELDSCAYNANGYLNYFSGYVWYDSTWVPNILDGVSVPDGPGTASFLGCRVMISYKLTSITGIHATEQNTPMGFSLSQSYPNPFNPSTTISFALPSQSFVTLRIFDLLGREISTIVSEDLPPGLYSREWDASRFASGIYFYRLQAGSFTETKKLMLLK
jgi:hypothetical protein